jgi:hypothetical protein
LGSEQIPKKSSAIVLTVALPWVWGVCDLPSWPYIEKNIYFVQLIFYITLYVFYSWSSHILIYASQNAYFPHMHCIMANLKNEYIIKVSVCCLFMYSWRNSLIKVAIPRYHDLPLVFDQSYSENIVGASFLSPENLNW